MSRSAVRNAHALQSSTLSHHRGRSLTAMPIHPSDENLDLFSRSRRSVSLASSDDSSDGEWNGIEKWNYNPFRKPNTTLVDNDAYSSIKLGRLSVGSAKVARTGIDDLLLSLSEGEKHDYDWLLTPPGTPLFPSADGGSAQPSKGRSVDRSTSTTKASRLSVSQSECNHASRPIRSSSATRSSVSTSHYSTYSSIRSSSSILNTSSASVSSYTRPSSPITRSSSSARPSTPSARSTVSRSSTPSRVHPTSRSSSSERPQLSHISRPSSPSPRPQISTIVSSPDAPRQNSRPSTPTRRSSTLSSPNPINSTATTSQVIQNGRTPALTSRLGSPSLRPRPLPQPITPPDFPLETPPNLRTTLPDCPLSVGRSRPGAAVTVKGNHVITTPTSLARRQLSPVVARGRLVSTNVNGRTSGNANGTDITEPRKALISPELGTRKPVKTVTSPINRTGFGRLTSKNSLDVAMRHMDIRNGTGTIRVLSGTTLFPQSIRTSDAKTQSIRAASAPTSVNMDVTKNGAGSTNGRYSAKVTDLDINESSRYEAMLLREDSRNTNWLHSIDDNSDQGSTFESGLEFLPEPFGPL